MDWLGDEFVTPEDKKRAATRKVDLKNKVAILTEKRKILDKSTDKSEEKEAILKDYEKRIESLNSAADENITLRGNYSIDHPNPTFEVGKYLLNANQLMFGRALSFKNYLVKLGANPNQITPSTGGNGNVNTTIQYDSSKN